MKTLLLAAFAVAASPAFAQDMPCQVKQKNAASFTIAQDVGVPVQGVEVLSFENGMWTEMPGNNTGTDSVTVRVGNRTNRGMTIKKYAVTVKQIGQTNDCAVKFVEEAKN